jgi:hypothetical protein
MELITRTVYGASLQTSLLLNIPVDIKPNTTLNEKFGIFPTTFITQQDRPSMRYVAIGNGGHRSITGPEGISVPDPVQHTSTDAVLYKHLPFVLRDPANDLTPVQRANYGLRRVQSHDGKPYIAYYLKRLDYTTVVSKLDFKTVQEGGATTTSEFIPNSSNLEPIPPALSSTGVNVTTGNYISATAKIPFTLNESDIQELLDAATIIYGDDNYAIISEIALCSGVDKVLTIDAGQPGSFNMNEVIGAQVVTFFNTFFSCKFDNKGIDILLDVGASEPLFVLAPAT